MGGPGSGTIDAIAIRLDGTKIKEDGTEEKSNFFDVLELPEGEYSDIQLTPEQAMKFKNFAIRMKFGTSAMMPLKCLGGSKCPVKSCPFSNETRYPVGQICPFEASFVQAKTRDYIEDLGIDQDNATLMSMVNRLVELDLLEFRTNAGLSSDEEAQGLLQRIESSNGEYTNSMLAIHPLIDIKEKHHRQRMQILEALVATPREKYKKAGALKKREQEDAAHYISQMRKTFQQITKKGAGAIEEIRKEAEKVNVEEEADWSEDGDLG